MEISDELSCSSSQDLTKEVMEFYHEASAFFDPLMKASTIGSNIYPTRPDYLATDGSGDFSATTKAIQDVIFYEPTKTWGPFWPNTLAEAQAILTPVNYIDDLQKLTGYPIEDDYFKQVILKCYNHNDRYLTQPESSYENILRRRCAAFQRYQDKWLVQTQCKQLTKALDHVQEVHFTALPELPLEDIRCDSPYEFLEEDLDSGFLGENNAPKRCVNDPTAKRVANSATHTFTTSQLNPCPHLYASTIEHTPKHSCNKTGVSNDNVTKKLLVKEKVTTLQQSIRQPILLIYSPKHTPKHAQKVSNRKTQHTQQKRVLPE
jgi:hypothetical protein